jgi:hypothetical protein
VNAVEAMRGIRRAIKGCYGLSLDVGDEFASLWTHYEGIPFRVAVKEDDVQAAAAEMIAKLEEHKKQQDKGGAA